MGLWRALPNLFRVGGYLTIHDYRPEWAAEFAAIGTELADLLGNVALRIDHIGSTAIPGLAAKDIIDIQVTVAALDEELLRERFVEAGYEWKVGYRDHQPPGMSLEAVELAKLFVRQPEGRRAANIHIRAAGRFNQRYALLFRDYLRAHPLVAAAYGEVKRRLVQVVDDDAEEYYAVKDPVIDVMMTGARAWAEATGWTPD